MNWLVCLASGTCPGTLGKISRFPSERSREARSNLAMVEFLDFIFDQGLMDLPLVGGISASNLPPT